jgi:hypothetical protein
VRMTVLPTSSVDACSNSVRIAVARAFAAGTRPPHAKYCAILGATLRQSSRRSIRHRRLTRAGASLTESKCRGFLSTGRSVD